MTETLEQVRARVRELEAEVAQLRARLEQRPTTEHTLVSGGSSSASMVGIEEMILQVSDDDTVRYANTPMTRLLGMPGDKESVIGTPLQRWDGGLLGNGFLRQVVSLARASGGPHVSEAAFSHLPPEVLPGAAGARPAGNVILRFVATPIERRVQIIVQDVTLLRWLETTFSRYVSPAVIKQMQSLNPAELMRMRRRELSVMFADLRGFTKCSQDLAPEEVQELLNSALSRMAISIEKYTGTIDKFTGDGCIAVFGSPIAFDDHALRSLCAAAEMQRQHAEWMDKRVAAGFPAPALGIGVASGDVVVGNVGTPVRMDYTVLGHTVNLAARLCGAAAPGETLIATETYLQARQHAGKLLGDIRLPHFSFQPRGQMTFKNIDQPVQVLSVVTR